MISWPWTRLKEELYELEKSLGEAGRARMAAEDACAKAIAAAGADTLEKNHRLKMTEAALKEAERLVLENAAEATQQAEMGARELEARHDAEERAERVEALLKEKTLQPGETPLRCPNPDCRSDHGVAVLGKLHDVVIRDGRAAVLETGYRLGCQAKGCATVWSVDRTGQFFQAPNALPLTPQFQTRQAEPTGAKKRDDGQPAIPPGARWMPGKELESP